MRKKKRIIWLLFNLPVPLLFGEKLLQFTENNLRISSKYTIDNGATEVTPEAITLGYDGTDYKWMITSGSDYYVATSRANDTVFKKAAVTVTDGVVTEITNVDNSATKTLKVERVDA